MTTGKQQIEKHNHEETVEIQVKALGMVAFLAGTTSALHPSPISPVVLPWPSLDLEERVETHS